jgi:hypothetical protein
MKAIKLKKNDKVKGKPMKRGITFYCHDDFDEGKIKDKEVVDPKPKEDKPEKVKKK